MTKRDLMIGFALLGAATALTACGKPRPAVSRECRQVVSMAALNVDAWRYIQASCSEEEQQSLLAEFRERGLSTDDIEKSRAAAKATPAGS